MTLLYTITWENAMGYLEEAKTKLIEGAKAKLSSRGEIMKKAVCDALIEFCSQDTEFAQAVAQGGSFADCMKAVEAAIKGGGISDLEAFGAAVRFYFPGAGIKCEMRINLCESVGAEDLPQPEKPKAGPIIDLSAFF